MWYKRIDWSECATLLREKRVPGEPPQAQNPEDRAAREKCNERKSTPDFSESILKKMDFFSVLVKHAEAHRHHC
ncbi:hypothetical protein EBO34_06850 [Alteribacter keqinensis]|uniref:Uncharacterized protein n=1 Tax=Alteribacter keqinensis TaxID=2483800 RepID=A0A3M7TWK0_9BACI|nr:hypothetical protein EBO34_06850 [Alteribacter keqinensis]